MKKLLKKTTLYTFILLVTGLLLLIILTIESSFYNPIDKTFGRETERIALINGQILNTKTGEIVPNQVILINNGLITDIVSDSTLDLDNYSVLDVRGKTLMHGLADMHTHVFDRAELTQYLSYGVTHVRNMMGFSNHLIWRDEVDRGVLTGSYLLTSGPTLNGSNNAPPLHNRLKSVEDARKAVVETKEKGYDFVKVYDGLSEEQLRTISETSADLVIPFAGHPVHNVKNKVVLDAGYQSIEHVEELFQGMMDFEFDSALAMHLVDELKAHETPVTITLSAYNHLYRTVLEKEDFLQTIPVDQITPFTRYLGQKSLEGWKTPTPSGYDWTLKKYGFMEYLVRLLDEKEVPLLLGTDTGPNLTVAGWSYHKEMELLQNLGIDELKIIQSGTSEAAKILGHPAFSGNIKEGTIANILILEENPLSDLHTLSLPEGIILDKMYYDKPTLVEMRIYSKEHFNPFLISVGEFLSFIFIG